jgi:hypothetical protein
MPVVDQPLPAAPAKVKPPTSKPVPLLQNNGFNGDINDFNERVLGVVTAHKQAFGYPPSPALTLAVARNADPPDYPGLFSRTSRHQARSQGALAAAGLAPTVPPNPKRPPNPANDLIAGFQTVKTEQDLNDYLTRNQTVISQTLGDTATHARFAAAYANTLKRLSSDAARNPMLAARKPENMGLAPDAVAKQGWGLIGKAVGQVASGLLLGPPTLAITEGKAVAQAFRDRSLTPVGRANVTLAKGVARGTVQDVEHPKENPGNLFLDALGLVSAGAGAAGRIARASAALEEGAGVAAAAKVALRRPVGGTATLRKGTIEEDQLLTENPALRWAQQKLVKIRNQRMADRGQETAATLSIELPRKIQDAVDLALDPLRATFSSENKLGREARARRQIETTIQMTLKRDLDQVAGWTQTAATAFQRINQRLPERMRGLTVGEQKAIQVLATDDPAPFDAWRQFHENMIHLEIGDPASHRAQLAALKLAEEVVANPRARFVKALDLTRQVIHEQQRIKIDELGLAADTAGRRVVGAGEYVRRAGTAATAGEAAALARPSALAGDLPPKLDESFYLPFQPKGKPRRGTSGRLESFSPQAGPGGIPIPAVPAELKHEFTGKSITAGDFRIDATSLAGETFARTVKAATKMNEWRRLWSAGTDTPRNLRFDRPVRDIRDFPDALRAVVNKALDAELTGEEALSLHPQDIQDLERFLFPGEQVNGRWRLDPAIEHVRWVDSRVIDKYRPPLPGAFRTTFQLLNEPFRDFALFLRPAYVLNLVGNIGMGLIQQGVLLPPNILRALRLEETHGERVARSIDALGGQSGRSASYAPANLGEGIGKALTTPGRVLASAWNTVTDQHLRRAAIVHELRRQLVDAGKDPNDLEGILFDESLAKRRNEGVRRGNKAMVEFDNQTWLEREALRHLIFVYPWTSRALVWSIRSIVEHPTQAAILNQIGREAEQEFPDVLQKAPEWFKELGYVPIGTNKDGSPKVVNPSSVNTFSTFSQLLYPLEAGFTSSKYSSLSDLFGPGATFLIHGATGKDQFGNTYPGSQWLGAAKEVWGQLPQLRQLNRKAGQPVKPLDLGDRNTLVTQLNSALKETVFTPGWLNGFGNLIVGGLSPRGVNPQALEARWYRDLPLADRRTIELGLIHKALQLQGGLVGKKVPANVSEAIDLSGARQSVYDELKTKLGRTPTAKEQLQADIGLFEQKAKLNQTDAATLQAKLAKITDPLELDRFRAGLYDKYGNAKDLQAWDEQVRFVYSFRPEILTGKLAALKAQGLVSSTKIPADQETLYAWGRKALAFYVEAKQRTARIAATTYTLPSERTAAEAELRAWTDTQDKPVVINAGGKPTYLVGKPGGLVKTGNIDINHRPVARNADGSISTVRSISIGTDAGETLIPTVVNGKVVSDEAAIAHYRRTGENLGTFSSVAAANRYAVALHDEQAQAYVVLPSPARMAWANATPDEQTQHLRSAATRSWSNLSNFDKTLLGIKPAQVASEAWATLDRWIAQAQAQLPAGQSLPSGTRAYWAGILAKRVPAFKADLELARQTLAQRLRRLTPVTKSPERPLWDQLLSAADERYRQLTGAGWSRSDAVDEWRRNDVPKLQAWIDEHPAFAKEVAAYGPSFLSSLVRTGT